MKSNRLNSIRVVLATATMLAVCSGILLTVNALSGKFVYWPVIVAGGILFTLIPASILEWLVHRYMYHSKQIGPLAQIYRIHHQGHHAAIFPTWRYTTNGPVRRHPVSNPDVTHLYPTGRQNLRSKLAHFGFYMALGFVFIWTPAWIATQNVLFIATIFITSAVISDLFVRVHDAIHYPGQFRVIEAQPWYPFIERHHYIHHVDMSANVNFLLPLADLCFGTLRTVMTPAEMKKHGSLEQAKANPVGHSEPAAIHASTLKRRPGVPDEAPATEPLHHGTLGAR